MRRFFLIAVLALFVIPAAVFAQDGKALWDLTNTFTVADLGFQFRYPADWVYSNDKGIVIADNQADLDAQTDSDDTTIPEGYVINLNGVPLDALGLKPDAKLEDIADILVKQAGVTENQQRANLAVMSRRSLTMFGDDKNGRSGLATIWVQDGNLVVMTIGAAKYTSDLAFSWGQILGSITPVGALELGDKPFTSPNGDFTMSYPKDWFASEKDGGIAEIEDDLKTMHSSTPPKGIAVAVLEAKLSQVGTDVKDLDSLVASMKKAEGWDDTVIPSEHLILDQTAWTYSGKSESLPGFTVIATLMVKDEDTTIIFVAVPDKEKVEDFMPTYLAMLASITAVEKAS
jgi:hypothetical protein